MKNGSWKKKTFLAILLLLVGIAIEYDAFFAEKTIRMVSDKNGSKSLSTFAKFIKDISINVPVLYGIFSIGLALILGVGAAIIRKIISDPKNFNRLLNVSSSDSVSLTLDFFFLNRLYSAKRNFILSETFSFMVIFYIMAVKLKIL